MNLQTKLKSIILRYEIGSISSEDAMDEIMQIQPFTTVFEPFTYEDFNEFMLKSIRRKGMIYTTEIWQVVGLSKDKVLIQFEDDFEWKLYSSMLEDFVFIDGNPFGKELK